jgi:hypothetical protein
MGLWTNDLRRHCARDVEFFAQPPTGTVVKRWFGGILVPGLVLLYGVGCVVSGEAWMPQKGSNDLIVTGTAAASLGAAWVALGLFCHFHFFWGLHERLNRFSQGLKMASLIVFLIFFLYGVVRGSHFDSLFHWG